MENAPPEPPPGGLIIKTYGRVLTRDAQDKLRHASKEDFLSRLDGWRDHLLEAAPDHLWLTEAEWKSLVPANPKEGQKLPVPSAITQRILSYQLVPERIGGEMSRGLARQGYSRRRADVDRRRGDRRRPPLAAGGIRSPGKALRLQRRGEAATSLDSSVSLTYDTKNKVLTRFDVVALGDVYGGGFGETVS